METNIFYLLLLAMWICGFVVGVGVAGMFHYRKKGVK